MSLKLASQMDNDTRIICWLKQWIAIDENCGELNKDSKPLRLWKSAGRRKSGRPTKYYLSGTGAINTPVIQAYTDEEALEIANGMIVIPEAAERIGATAEIVTTGAQLADREIEEGTDTGLGAQLQDAGYGSGGVM